MEADRPHRVVALVNSPQSPFELAIASEVFGIRRPDVPMDYEFSICSRVPGLIGTLAGYPIVVARGLEHLNEADTIVIPGWEPTGAQVPAEVLEALVLAHDRGVRLLSICTGAFVLAQTGLLNGRKATTHWRHLKTLADQFPQVHAQDDVLFIDNGDVATSAGTAAGLDMCLHVVRTDHGAARAARIARHMVMPPRREGDQRQYAVQPAPAATSGSLADLLDWAEQHLGQDLTLRVLAKRAYLSPRTLDRRFRGQLGVSPGKWLLGRRVDAARELLELTDLTTDAIATRVGLSSATNFRRRFYDAVGTTPTAYRRAFAVNPPESIPVASPLRELLSVSGGA
jgi:AraC family transcriptional regulator, transcriptional activator FtrA